MELKDIKQQLTINQVLRHYNLKPDKNDRLNCPSCWRKRPLVPVENKRK